MLNSVPLSNSALISETWLGHCIAQTAYICIQKTLGFAQWKQCTASMLCPLWFTKNPPSDPSRKRIPLPLGFQWPPVSREVDKSFHGPGIELTEVKTKAQTSIFLVHQDYCITAWALTGVNCTGLQHLLHVCSDLFHHVWRNPSKPLFKWFIIYNPDFKFC